MNRKKSKAKTACEVSGHRTTDHFADFRKMVEIGSGSQREISVIRESVFYPSFNDGEFAAIKPIEFDGFGISSTNLPKS